MNGIYLNGGNNKANFLKNFSYESASFTLMPLVFEKVYHASIMASCFSMLYFFKQPGGKYDDHLYETFLNIVKSLVPTPEMPDPEGTYLSYKKIIEETHMVNKKLNKIKHPNKRELVMKLKTQSFKKGIIDYVEKFYHSQYFFNDTHKLEWLWKEDTIIGLAAEAGGEHTSDRLLFVNYLCTAFENEDDFLYTDDVIEKTLQFIEAKACFSGDYNITAENWFISMPLHNLRSYITVMNEKEMRQVRNTFMQQTKLFHQPIIELEEQLEQTAFTSHNLPQISNLINQHLGSINIEEVNQNINNDPAILYFDKLVSDVNSTVTTLHLGITSPRMLLHHFQRLHIIQPFETTAVINTIEKFRNPDNAVAFFYTTMITEKDGITQRGMGIPLDDKTMELLDEVMPNISA